MQIPDPLSASICCNETEITYLWDTECFLSDMFTARKQASAFRAKDLGPFRGFFCPARHTSIYFRTRRRRVISKDLLSSDIHAHNNSNLQHLASAIIVSAGKSHDTQVSQPRGFDDDFSIIICIHQLRSKRAFRCLRGNIGLPPVPLEAYRCL